jgi:hypothetical protein
MTLCFFFETVHIAIEKWETPLDTYCIVNRSLDLFFFFDVVELSYAYFRYKTRCTETFENGGVTEYFQGTYQTKQWSVSV